VVGNFIQLHQFEFDRAPLEEIHHFGESGSPIHYFGGSEFGGAKLFSKLYVEWSYFW
jgi:hypothetical protein